MPSTSAERPLVVLLHALGLSGRSWDGVVDALGDRFDAFAPDLPGYGANAGSDALTLEQTAAWVAARLRERAPDRWLLVGHSMGGKIATLLTAWGERGEHGLIPPDGLVLVDPSPPSPKPMGEERRSRMARWWADGPISREHAEAFVASNAPGAASARLRADGIDDVQRASRTAVLGWLERGTREDWGDAVGVLRTPTAFVSSTGSGDLGAPTQRRLGLPHFRDAALHEIDGAGHFVVLEQPAEVARCVADHWARVEGRRPFPAAFGRLIASDRVSARTRRAMLARLDGPGDAPHALGAPRRALLAALLARVLPQRGTDLDLAARIDGRLAAGTGDGWRFGDLPPDAEAWRRALDTVAASVDFAGLGREEQDDLLRRIEGGDLGADGPGLLTGEQMALWFQDLCAEAVRVWLSHPAAQAWLRYDGFADGGDGVRKQGWLRTHAGEYEPWQRDWRTGKERRG